MPGTLNQWWADPQSRSQCRLRSLKALIHAANVQEGCRYGGTGCRMSGFSLGVCVVTKALNPSMWTDYFKLSYSVTKQTFVGFYTMQANQNTECPRDKCKTWVPVVICFYVPSFGWKVDLVRGLGRKPIYQTFKLDFVPHHHFKPYGVI